MCLNLPVKLIKTEVHRDNEFSYKYLSFEKKENVWCDLQVKSLITSDIDENLPSPFTLQCPFPSSFSPGNVIASESNAKQCVLIIMPAACLKKKLRLSDANQINFTSRFRSSNPFLNIFIFGQVNV